MYLHIHVGIKVDQFQFTWFLEIRYIMETTSSVKNFSSTNGVTGRKLSILFNFPKFVTNLSVRIRLSKILKQESRVSGGHILHISKMAQYHS